MHLLGHSFSQRCKRSKRPRDLHIRKVSFSGSSLSGCSLSSSGSTASACTAIIPPQYAEHAPPRLHERPFKAGQTQPPRFAPTFYDDDIDADDEEDYQAAGEDDDEDSSDEDDENLPHFEMEMPPHSSPSDHDTGHDRNDDSSDYFLLHLTKRPSLPRSRWSESTIQSVQTIDAIATPGSVISTAATETGMDQGPPVKVEMPPNFSYKRAVSTPAAGPKPGATASKRPPMKTMDSIDEFVKRGGWKRRGIVFQQQEVEANHDNSF